MFTTLAIEEIYDIFIVQQCRMLQSHTGIDCVSRCLNNLDNVSETVKSLREEILKADYDALLKSQSQHLCTKFVAEVARSSSWRRLWDLALDKGTKGTTIMQLLFKELSRPKFGDNCCNVCNAPTVSDRNCFEHAVMFHSNLIGINSFEHDILSTITADSCDSLFNNIQLISNCKTVWSHEGH